MSPESSMGGEELRRKRCGGFEKVFHCALFVDEPVL